MIKTINNETMVLTGNLRLEELSAQNIPAMNAYQNVKIIDLQQLKNIDSAGLAYLVNIKNHYSAMRFTGVPDKILVLGNLYGLSFLF